MRHPPAESGLAFIRNAAQADSQRGIVQGGAAKTPLLPFIFPALPSDFLRFAFFPHSLSLFRQSFPKLSFRPFSLVSLFPALSAFPRLRFPARIPLRFPFPPVLRNFARAKKSPAKKAESSFIFPIDDPAVRKVRQSFEKSPHGQSRFP